MQSTKVIDLEELSRERLNLPVLAAVASKHIATHNSDIF